MAQSWSGCGRSHCCQIGNRDLELSSSQSPSPSSPPRSNATLTSSSSSLSLRREPALIVFSSSDLCKNHSCSMGTWNPLWLALPLLSFVPPTPFHFPAAAALYIIKVIIRLITFVLIGSILSQPLHAVRLCLITSMPVYSLDLHPTTSQK